MDQQEIIKGIEDRAIAVGVSMRQVCERAGVAASTFSRWKLSDRNPDPIGATISSLSKIDEALRAFEMDRAA